MMSGEIWVLIPVAAIVSGVVRQWIRSNAAQRRLNAETRGLETDMAALTRTNEELNQRIQNLETIVVSQTWKVLNDPNLSGADRNLHVATAAHQESRVDLAQANQQRAEQLARRLQ